MIKLINILKESLYNFKPLKDLTKSVVEVYGEDGYTDECPINKPIIVKWKNGKEEKFDIYPETLEVTDHDPDQGTEWNIEAFNDDESKGITLSVKPNYTDIYDEVLESIDIERLISADYYGDSLNESHNVRIPSIEYYEQILNKTPFSIKEKTYYQKLIDSIKKQKGFATPNQYHTLQNIKKGKISK